MELTKRAIEYIREFKDYTYWMEAMKGIHPYQREENNPPVWNLSLSGILETDFEKKPLEDIPNSDKYVLIDIGSHLGTRITLPFARQRPNVQVYLVDKLKKHNLLSDIAYESFYKRPNFDSNDIEGSINRLLWANGYSNVRYIEKRIDFDSLELGIEKDIENKKIAVVGFKNPAGLGNLTLLEAIRLNAQRIYITNSSLENIPSDSKHFNFLRDNLDGCAEEIIPLFKDGEVRYPYECGEKNRLALAVKLLFILSQKSKLEEEGYKVQIMENSKPVNKHFNQPDYNLFACK